MVKKTAMLFLAAVFLCCCREEKQAQIPQEKGEPMEIKVTSPAFEQGQAIPPKYTCDGQDISLPLLYNIAPDTRQLPADIGGEQPLPEGAQEGINSWQNTGYGGPCPPPPATHRYFFTIYALDSKLDFKQPPSKDELTKAMNNHILAKGRLMGRYKRK